ncbi:MAG: FG-GAP repeat domain-containing protein [Roseibacillus sp.]
MTLSKSIPERGTPTPRPVLALLLPLCVLCCGANLFLSWSWLPAAAILLAVATLVVGWRRIGWGWTALFVLTLAMPGCKPTQRPIQDSIVGNDAAQIRELVSVEERILALTPQLHELSKSMQNLRLPDRPRLIHFASEVTVAEAGQTAVTSAPGDLDLLRPLLKEVAWIEQASFYFIDGRFPDEEEGLFEGEVAFRGLAKLKSGGWQGLIGKFLIRWTKDSGEEDAEWKISGWEQKELVTMASARRLFGDALSTALPRPADRALAHRSPHQEAAIKFYQGGAQKHPHPYFAPISVNQKPGLAVVDIDSDGDDDIYVTVRIGRNLLFENQGDGTFVEAAEKYGIHFTGHCTCALFGDFDNDGDPDLFVGRSLRPSLYFENRAGHFYPGPQQNEFPMTAVSASAADYNGDGLLDLYLLTYRPSTIDGDSSPSGGVGVQSERWPDHFYPPEMAEEYYRRHREANSGNDPRFPNLLNQIGPPNILYVNRGKGRFEIAEESTQLGIWRNSLQATWADYDEDGDPDVFIANDWAPDNLFRNDGESGFTDVTKEAGLTEFGFAMGATWGDYDNDGLQDLYVSNMFSKAGARITNRVPGIAEIYKQSAAGNYLYRQRANHSFELVSGDNPPALAVAKAGWSWGGQFADFDNDGFLDLYVLSGYFTAPEAVSSELDL